ncbi:hypothetical protein H072_7681 [Dactylellina haptotyla CBS 200.50]|uniref:Origin recognition complex subunit 3 winged helix C-terminal domain-containing protein n=1 Tax=Dactylellina haptotyla (strain CBS 200.50) TaxID=1284197 RepID=S8BH05_DACHA|nr:hypothetical protein H072_7681 [Dactylellina haptotyla CBS 200.50]
MDNDSVLNDEAGSLEHQACYIYTPTSDALQSTPKKRKAVSTSRTPTSKREKVDSQNCDGDETRKHGFPTLLRDLEDKDTVKARYHAFDRLWRDVERRTNDVLAQVNEETLEAVSTFVGESSPERYGEKLPTGLILTGPNIAAHGILFEQINTRIQNVDRHGRVAILTSKDSSNLKNVLKKVIRLVTEIQSGEDEEDEILEPQGGRSTSRYNYDPEIIQDWCLNHPGSKVVVAIQDTEAFDPAVLVELISILYQYVHKIPFILLLGIATSEEIFYEKLPHSTIRLLRGDRFDVQRFEESMEQVFEEAVLSSQSLLKLGPRVADLIFERQKDHTRSVGSFVMALKYAYMTHFYANALSVILGFVDDEQSLNKVLSDAHCEAIRNLPSFKNLVESTIPTFPWRARDLLTSNTSLKSAVLSASKECQRYSSNLAEAVNLFRKLQSVVSPQQASEIPTYELYSRILWGEFTTRPAFRDAILTTKKAGSEKFLLLLNTLAELPSEFSSSFAESASKVEALQAGKTKKGGLITEFALPDSHRTTVKSGRVRLDELKSGMTSQDNDYNKIVTSTVQTLENYFKERFKPYTNLFLHEIFFYDLKSPHSQVFAPKPRPSIERALSRPGDYLGCDCCNAGGEDAGIEGSQPYSAILYQLYLESPALIGIYDLWSAFRVVSLGDKADEEADEDDEEEKELQAQFYRALSELRYLGFLKYSKKKTDHLVKLAWKGL